MQDFCEKFETFLPRNLHLSPTSFGKAAFKATAAGATIFMFLVDVASAFVDIGQRIPNRFGLCGMLNVDGGALLQGQNFRNFPKSLHWENTSTFMMTFCLIILCVFAAVHQLNERRCTFLHFWQRILLGDYLPLKELLFDNFFAGLSHLSSSSKFKVFRERLTRLQLTKEAVSSEADKAVAQRQILNDYSDDSRGPKRSKSAFFCRTLCTF